MAREHTEKPPKNRGAAFRQRLFGIDEQDAFTRNLTIEVMRSERIRSLAIMAIALSLTVWFQVIGALAPGRFAALTTTEWQGHSFFTWFAISFSIVAVYEALYTGGLSLFIHEGLRFPAPARFANAFIEISIPTAILAVGIQILNPADALNTPIVYFYFIFIALSALRMNLALSLFTGTVAAVEYALASWLAVGHAGDWADAVFIASKGIVMAKAGILLLGGLVTGFVAVQIRKRLTNSFKSIEERNRVVSIFGQHVSPVVVDRLLAQHGDLPGETRFVCIMFLDIRGFTAFTEGREPGEVMAYLNHLFDYMIEIVNRHGGIINKFLGDGFMAVFGAPLSDGRDAQNAAAAALAILERTTIESAAGRIPATRLGIGLHAGPAMTGIVGSAARKEYTIIGDVVNLASRIEQLTKQFDACCLISEAVFQALGDEAAGAADLGSVAVRGHAGPVRVHRLA